jgi:hypothetical protein
MDFIIKSSAVAPGCRPIHRWTLITLLKRFGIQEVRCPYHGHRAIMGRHIRRSLWDIWDLVKARWGVLRRKLHPDVTGQGYEAFAVMSAVHDAILVRLKAKGIGP